MSQDLATDKDDWNRTEWTIREHLLREPRERRADVKSGNYSMEDAPTWKPRPIPTEPVRVSRYSKDPRKCEHQFAGNRMACPYCATTNPDWQP